MTSSELVVPAAVAPICSRDAVQWISIQLCLRKSDPTRNAERFDNVLRASWCHLHTIAKYAVDPRPGVFRLDNPPDAARVSLHETRRGCVGLPAESLN